MDAEYLLKISQEPPRNRNPLRFDLGLDGVVGPTNIFFVVLYLGFFCSLIYIWLTREITDYFVRKTFLVLGIALIIRCVMCTLDFTTNHNYIED